MVQVKDIGRQHTHLGAEWLEPKFRPTIAEMQQTELKSNNFTVMLDFGGTV